MSDPTSPRRCSECQSRFVPRATAQKRQIVCSERCRKARRARRARARRHDALEACRKVERDRQKVYRATAPEPTGDPAEMQLPLATVVGLVTDGFDRLNLSLTAFKRNLLRALRAAARRGS